MDALLRKVTPAAARMTLRGSESPSSRMKRAPRARRAGRDKPSAAGSFREPLVERRRAEELWGFHWCQATQGSRNELLLEYQPLVRNVIMRLPAEIRAHWPDGDLESFGLFGLIDAIERFGSGSPVDRFESYAATRVRGAVFDELRRLDWLPRRARQQVIAYRTTKDLLATSLGRAPFESEVLRELGASGDAATEVLQAVQSSQLLHLQHGVAGSASTWTTEVAELLPSNQDDEPDHALLEAEERTSLLEAVGKLPDRQRTVITLHFLSGLSQAQVGAVLGVSNSRVCQIEATALKTLHRVLGSPEPALVAIPA